MLNVAIIGGGPAGLTAGLYTTRGGIKDVVLFEKGMPGGQITGSSEIENYPGVAEIKSGLDFMEPWQEQCFRFGLKREMADVRQITKEGEHFVIHYDVDSKVEAKSVILATGGRPRKMGIAGEEQYWGKGISTCATCDGFFHKDKEVVVIGGGDTALEEAIYLTKMCSKVTLVHRRDEFRGAPITLEHARANPKIEFLTPYAPIQVKGNDKKATSVVLENTKTKEQKEIEFSGLFIFVGYEVNTQVLKQDNGSMLCASEDNGSIIVDLSMKTNVKGLFAAGDIRINAPKQVVCAAGDGAAAALSAIAYLDSLH